MIYAIVFVLICLDYGPNRVVFSSCFFFISIHLDHNLNGLFFLFYFNPFRLWLKGYNLVYLSKAHPQEGYLARIS
jgi:hypothetical protein